MVIMWGIIVLLENLYHNISLMKGRFFMAFLIFLLCVALIVILVYTAHQFYLIALMKGHRVYQYFVLPLIFPLAGYLLVLALPDLKRDDRGNEGNTRNGGYINTMAGTPANTMPNTMPNTMSNELPEL